MVNLIDERQTGLITLLTAVTTTQRSSIFDLGFIADRMTWEVIVTGGPTMSVTLEGSIDGTRLYALDTTTGSTMRHVVNKPVRYICANLTSLSGGTNPTVTVVFIGKG